MTRFILLSFALLGWTFYELSGGADFEPRKERPAEPEIVAQATEAAPERPKTTGAKTGLRTIEASSLVASPAIAPRPKVSVQPITAEVQETPEIDLPTPEETAAKLSRVRLTLNQNSTLFPVAGSEETLTLASLEDGAASLRSDATPSPTLPETAETAETPAPPPADIREITGTRVNMRDGPGTIYPVIRRVSIGQQVEVLGESGTGWLRLRTLPDRQIGWISASLVSDKTD